ncbi:MAG: phosphate starvation-inducible PhoH-like protein [Halieaceae bacterium]
MITEESSHSQLTLEPDNSHHLAELCGQFDQHLKQIESRLGVHIRARGNQFHIEGPADNTEVATRLLTALYRDVTEGVRLSPETIHLHLQQAGVEELVIQGDSVQALTVVHTPRSVIKPRGHNQQVYVRAIKDHDISFGVGPAGTGKTYLAVACAVEALRNEQVRRILLVRPAVEAGEKLGFLPGDLSQKIDPYLRPLYDALYEMLGYETVAKYVERSIIEIAPLAYMRGRTLSNSFIILDEAQNTTREQMKMFLTRIGFGSQAVITGDATQIDLPRGQPSGLTHVMRVLENVKPIHFSYFQAKDVIRHPLVQKIVEAYEDHDASQTPSLDKNQV